MVTKIEMIYEDKNIVVVNKPIGIFVIPDRHICKNKTLVGISEKQLKQKLCVVHKIDRDATGVLVFAKNQQVHKNICIQFANSKIRRKYVALLSGVLDEDESAINNIFILPRDTSVSNAEKESVVDFKVLERFRNYTLIEVDLSTAVRHQIRTHFSDIGHPFAIDAEYGISEPIFLSSLKHNYKIKDNEKEKPLIARLTLHALSLTLTLPESSEEKTFETPLPKDFEVVIKQLRKYGR